MSNIIKDKQQFIEYLQIKNYAPRTVEQRDEEIDLFINWCADRAIYTSQAITRHHIEGYQRHLHHYKKKDGNPLSIGVQVSRLTAIKVFCRWLTRQHHIPYNPASEIEMPKSPKRLPKNILSQSEVEHVINQPDTNTVLGLRDRAILEVLYSTGIRRMELVNLKKNDLDTERGTLRVNLGKGAKDRVVPIGERALRWVQQYLDIARDQHAPYPDIDTIFLMRNRTPFTPHRLSQMVRQTIQASGVRKVGSCHLLRHTMATLMLENGADVRYIQAILGHEDLATTQVYTQVSIKKIKEVHTKTHPAKMHRTKTIANTENTTELEVTD